MSEQDLRKMIDFASQFCERMFAMKGEIHAQYHAVPAQGAHFIHVPTGDKDTAVAMTRALFELRDVVRYIFFAEAWTVAKPIGDEELKRMMKRGGVSMHPERVEIIMLQGEDREAGMIMAQRRIIRTGKRAHLGPLEWQDIKGPGRSSEGRMVGLLPVKGMRQ